MTRADHIKKAFEGDSEIFKYYDPTKNVSTINDIVNDVMNKLWEYESSFECGFVGTDNGYFFYTVEPRLLISFGVNKDSRNKENLSIFWNTILKTVGNEFTCGLFTKNSRAIGWLERMGMTKIKEHGLITILKN